VDRALEDFYDGLKHNTSIDELVLLLLPSDWCRMFDLEYLMLHNQHLECLTLCTKDEDRLLSDQCMVIASALQHKKLYSFDIHECNFSPNEYGMVLAACSKVKILRVSCKHDYQKTALNALLQNPYAIIEELFIGTDRESDMSTIKEGLTRNKTIKKLSGELTVEFSSSVLCDPSSIETICNSNHTVRSVGSRLVLWSHDRFCLGCLELNKNPNKEQVIRNKILRYYFVGAFDLSPFSAMPVSVLPAVMTEIGGDEGNHQTAIFQEGNRQSALFRLLKGLPELCNVSSRALETYYKTTDVSSNSKRQKI
jgi:hypothetical protein